MPSAGGKLFSLQSIQHTQDFIDIEADGQIVAGIPGDFAARIYDVGGSEGAAYVGWKKDQILLNGSSWGSLSIWK